MADTTTTQIDSMINNWAEKTLLARAYPHFVHAMWAQVRDIPSKNSTVIKFRRYTNLTAATTALTEGVTPTSTQLAKTDVTATVNYWTAVVKFFLIQLSPLSQSRLFFYRG